MSDVAPLGPTGPYTTSGADLHDQRPTSHSGWHRCFHLTPAWSPLDATRCNSERPRSRRARVDLDTLPPGGDQAVRNLPIDVAIDGYVPRQIPEATWRVIEDEVRQIVRDSQPATGTSADHHMLAVTHFLAWAVDQQRSRERERLFVPEVVEQYVATACGHLSPVSRGTRRSVLRTIGRRVTRKARWDSPAPVYPTSKSRPPYTDEQCRWLVKCVDSQSSPFRRRVLQSLLGLGLGAGLTPDEIAFLTTDSVINAAPGRVAIELPARVVPVRTRYAPLLETLVRSLPTGAFLIRDKPVPRVETISQLIGNCDLPTSLRPLTMSRLRLTWALDALASSAPLPAVMAAYGCRSLKFTEPLLPHLIDLAASADITSDPRLYDF